MTVQEYIARILSAPEDLSQSQLLGENVPHHEHKNEFLIT